MIEISSIYFNMIRNQLGLGTITGFSQVAELQVVRDHMKRGRDISAKHIEIFGSLLSEDLLPSASSWSTQPTASTTAPFSDKLMMLQVSALISSSIAHYGSSIGTSQRRDLATHYTRLMAELAAYAEDSANIMIDHGWLEEPPQAVDRDQLAK
ncbi:DUF3231 family protein [Halobacillus shinanisalinarum]|uniref:DUF3231 family protein n=1 Tax=Halobacillus shinanisalinarum TaxID=2932258 RepID=A0ABY4GTS9_9BACI|nr:DUF3231 family protein [Halobacillus shinanisalinarum]UOQ91543.1 DUF3231 family protein [Halobacillus shinanisalinarum]